MSLQATAAEPLPAKILDQASFTRPIEPALLMRMLQADERRQVPVASIDESPFNPRKVFDDIEDLAQSIQAQGLIEDLVVRVVKAGRYELIAGARRLRALKLIKAKDVWVKVRKATDAEAKATQIVENLQRKNVKALEEAEGFKSLQAEDPRRWTVQEIARAVGKTARFVQQRLAIATNLQPDLKKKLAAGEITVEVARTLAPLPASLQQQLQGHHDIDSDDPADLRRAITSTAIPLGRARFDPALYTGERLEQGKTTYCLNIDQFRQLQTAEARKVVEKLTKDWPDARLSDDPEAWHWADDQWGHDTVDRNGWNNKREPSRYLVPKAKCTAIVWVAKNGEIKVAEGVCRTAAVTAARSEREKKRGGSSSMGYGGSRGEKKDHKAARTAYNKAFATALAKRTDLASRLQLLHLLTANNFGQSKHKLVPKELRGLTKGYLTRPADEAKLWAVIAKMTAAAAAGIVVRLTLAEAPEWGQYSYNSLPLGMNAIAETIGVAIPDVALGKKAAKVEKPKARPKAAPRRKIASKKAAKSRKKL